MKPSKRPPAPEPTLVQKLRKAVGSLWGGRSDGEPSSKAASKSGGKKSSQLQPTGTDAPARNEEQSEHDELARMCKALTTALDARPNNRKALPHLAVMEQHLRKSGLQVFGRAPLALLTKAHDQLLLLAGGHSELRDGALMQTLREHIAHRGQDVTVVDDVAWRTPRDSDLMVMEGRMSDFMAADEAAKAPADPGKPQS